MTATTLRAMATELGREACAAYTQAFCLMLPQDPREDEVTVLHRVTVEMATVYLYNAHRLWEQRRTLHRAIAVLRFFESRGLDACRDGTECAACGEKPHDPDCALASLLRPGGG
jgi:hypothetical protein